MVRMNIEIPKICNDCPCFRDSGFWGTFCWRSGVVYDIWPEKGIYNEGCLIYSPENQLANKHCSTCKNTYTMEDENGSQILVCGAHGDSIVDPESPACDDFN